MHKIKLRLHEIYILVCIYISKALKIFMRKDHWVLVERGSDARDNAYCFYCYMKKEHPEKKIYYIIDRKSSDYEKVKEDAVQLGSFRSFLLLASAERLISTHYGTGLRLASNRLFRLLRLDDKVCFLQHGITYNEQRDLFGDSAPMRLFFCGAKTEYEYIRRVFGHPDSVVKYTGFARFDRLHDARVLNRVLIMPTWRSYIRNEEEFLKSDYFAHFQSLISDEKLINALESKGTDLVLYVHYGMQKFIHHFKSKSALVKIAGFKDYDVQALLKESALLVTDYSSVFFDFAYMRKPVLYYQFDFDAFYAGHYLPGEFSYEKDGFGEVCLDKSQLVDAIIAHLNNDMKPEERYLERMEAYFPLFDNRNCERIYNEIVKN